MQDGIWIAPKFSWGPSWCSPYFKPMHCFQPTSSTQSQFSCSAGRQIRDKTNPLWRQQEIPDSREEEASLLTEAKPDTYYSLHPGPWEICIPNTFGWHIPTLIMIKCDSRGLREKSSKILTTSSSSSSFMVILQSDSRWEPVNLQKSL